MFGLHELFLLATPGLLSGVLFAVIPRLRRLQRTSVINAIGFSIVLVVIALGLVWTPVDLGRFADGFPASSELLRRLSLIPFFTLIGIGVAVISIPVAIGVRSLILLIWRTGGESG